MKELWTKGRRRVQRRVRALRADRGRGPSRRRSHTAGPSGRRAARHAASAWWDCCDGWFRARPQRRARAHRAGRAEGDRAAKAGRDMKTITTSVFGAAADAAQLDRVGAAGICRTHPPAAARRAATKVLPMLDQWAKLIRESGPLGAGVGQRGSCARPASAAAYRRRRRSPARRPGLLRLRRRALLLGGRRPASARRNLRLPEQHRGEPASRWWSIAGTRTGASSAG